MPVVLQPGGMTNALGVVVEIGIKQPAGPAAIVIPLVTNSTTLDGGNICGDVIDSLQASGPIGQLQDMISADCFITHINAIGMIAGRTPSRVDFGPTTLPGSRGTPTLADQTAFLVAWYQDFRDAAGRTKLAKNFIPGIAQGDFDGIAMVSALVTNFSLFAQTLQNGFASVGDPSSNWYRCLKANRKSLPSAATIRVAEYGVRTYAVTQKRRLLPRL